VGQRSWRRGTSTTVTAPHSTFVKINCAGAVECSKPSCRYERGAFTGRAASAGASSTPTAARAPLDEVGEAPPEFA